MRDREPLGSRANAQDAWPGRGLQEVRALVTGDTARDFSAESGWTRSLASSLGLGPFHLLLEKARSVPLSGKWSL